MVKIGKSSFNTEAVKKMSEKKFIAAHPKLENAKEIYEQICGASKGEVKGK